MQRQKIEDSSNISEIGYDDEAKTLEIKFNNGSIYQYWPITILGYESLMSSESKGGYFNKVIRSNPKINVQKVPEIQAGG